VSEAHLQACGLSAIDWQRPWLAPFATRGCAAQEQVAQHGQVAQALNQSAEEFSAGLGVRFVPQSALPAGTAYEAFIHTQGQVPTRDNLHDFFNGLVWQQYPLLKRRMNQLQAQAIAQQGVGAQRGPVRDALTVFDENGAVLLAPEPLWQALLERQWRRLFVELRPLWREARLCIVGHALLEQLVQPRKPLTAHVYRPRSTWNGAQAVDAWLAQDLEAEHLARKPFTPLPVLGIPGWWAENENFSFYDDSFVFRSARPIQAIQQGAPGTTVPA
jgi:hypothetical protein